MAHTFPPQSCQFLAIPTLHEVHAVSSCSSKNSQSVVIVVATYEQMDVGIETKTTDYVAGIDRIMTEST